MAGVWTLISLMAYAFQEGKDHFRSKLMLQSHLLGTLNLSDDRLARSVFYFGYGLGQEANVDES